MDFAFQNKKIKPFRRLKNSNYPQKRSLISLKILQIQNEIFFKKIKIIFFKLPNISNINSISKRPIIAF
ncbi:unnamed protein product [Blepharisma stoltei]|uniref:Uncharacterized protein n=1 Tax=Blepharisma stoltei TaxID=1481888 RepID=A0AAU9ID30_9CILI|nr:unnamed protein product [Blepharisma stoltei]